jgi:RHS repeat-associated protein
MKTKNQRFVVSVALVGLLMALSPAPAHSATSYTDQVRSVPLFTTPLEWVGERPPAENDSSALLAAISAFQAGEGFAALEAFLTANPDSAWSPSLEVNVAEHYRNVGRYSLALSHWQSVWETTKLSQYANGQRIAVRAIAGWTRLLGSLGEKDQVVALFTEFDSLNLPPGRYGTMIEATKGGVATMKSRPGNTYRCGSFALGHMARALNVSPEAVSKLQGTPSPDGGFRMSQLLDLGATNGIAVEAVRRPAGAELILPCVVHWKLNHYAAILERQGNRYRVLDPTFGRHIWMDRETIDAEASGEFLVASGKAPTSWHRLTSDEANSIFGKGNANDFNDWDDDDDGCAGGDGNSDQPPTNCDPPTSNEGAGGGGPPPPPPQCCQGGGAPTGSDDNEDADDDDSGMAGWRVSEPCITLWLHDTPLRYRLSSGSWMKWRITYKSRGELKGQNVGGFGDKWSCEMLGMLQSSTNSSDLANYLAGGGQQFFQTNGTPDYKTARTIGFRKTTNIVTGVVTTVLNITAPTGEVNTYDYNAGFLADGITNYFLTRRLDRYGRSTLYSYETVGTVTRATNFVDIDGRTNTLAYTNTTFQNLITSITDPYGNVARFFYDSSGRLTNITDAAQMSSSFQYDSSDNITNLLTPYGTNRFQYFATSTNFSERGMIITEASGDHQMYAFKTNHPGTSYHWNRAQYQQVSVAGQANPFNVSAADLNLAEARLWLHGLYDTVSNAITVSDSLFQWQPPVDPNLAASPGYVTYSYMGQNGGTIGASTNGGLKRVTSVSISGNQVLGVEYNTMGRPLIVTNYNQPSLNTTGTMSYTNVYDSSGQRLLQQWGSRGQLVRGYGYDPVVTNLLTSMTNALGQVLRYTHDTNTMKVTSIIFPSGMVRSNIYYSSGPSQGFLLMQMDIGIRTNSYSYTNGNVLTHTNELGRVTTFGWDKLNRLVSKAFPDGTTISNVYSSLDLAAIKDRLNQWTYYGYNPVRQLTAVTNVNSQVTQYSYCGCGSPSQIIRLNGLTQLKTTINYDILGRVATVIYPDGYSVTNSYDNVNRLSSSTDSANRSLYYRYGNIATRFIPVEVDNNLGPLLQQTFDEYGRLTNSIDRNNVNTAFEYDLIDELISRQKISQFVNEGAESFVYTAAGLTNYIDPRGKVTTFVRDVAGRVHYETNANNELLAFTNNPADELLSLTDGKNQTTRWTYDSYGRVTNKIDAAGNTLFVYQYDALDRLTNRWTAAKSNTAYKYDPIGNLTNVVYPVSSSILFQYDGVNRLTSMADGLGTTTFSWTDGDQLASEQGPWADDTASYSYANRLRSTMSIAAPNADPWLQSYFWDASSRLTNLTSAAGTFNYTYNPAASSDQVIYLSLANAGQVQNGYDGLARTSWTWISASFNGVLSEQAYSYDLGSQRTQQVFTGYFLGGGHYMNYTYDNIGQLKTAQGFESNGAPSRLHEQFGYAYDKAGNLNYRTNNALVQTFSVNNMNEIGNVTRSGTLTVSGSTTEPPPSQNTPYGVTSITVSGTGLAAGSASLYSDGTWAMTNANLADGVNTYTAVAQDNAGRQDSSTVTLNLAATNTCAYDLNGNLRTNGTRIFDYDDENQLVRVTEPNAWKSEFTYDGLMRRRITKEFAWSSGAWLETNEIRYVYDGRLVVQERDANNLPVVSYTRGIDLSSSLDGAGGIGGLIARTDHRLLTVGDPNANAYYHADGNGNITALMNGNGLLVASYTYDPFGNMLSMSGPLADANVYRFSSKEFGRNSGLYYYGFRFYDANSQRWLNRDPVGEAPDSNLYRFTYSDPINLIDPDGLWGIQFGGYNIGHGAPSYVFDGGTDWGGYAGDVGDTLAGEAKGAGAELSFGLYKPCYTSSLQRQGGYVGTGLAMAGETLAGWGAAGKAVKGATEYSHWIPARALQGGRGGLLDKVTRAARLNGNNVSKAEHALSDPWRYRFMPQAWKKANPLPNAFEQQLHRLPRFPLGMAAAAAGGYGSSQGNEGCQ